MQLLLFVVWSGIYYKPLKTLFVCITCLLSSTFVLAGKETEQTIAHALITKDVFLSLSLPRPLPRPVSVISLSWLFFLRSPETFLVDERKHKLNIKTPRSPLNTCHLSFVQIMARVAIETALFIYLVMLLLILFFLLTLLVRKRERGWEKQTVREKTTVDYEYGGMIKNETFKNPVCHRVKDERWVKDMYCGSLWTDWLIKSFFPRQMEDGLFF